MRLPARIPELDGFRAIAVLMVMGEHMYDGWRLPAIAMPHFIHFVLTHGWLGVDLFFVLSGFLITGILMDSRGKPDYFQGFYRRRALRILPVAFVCILIWAFAYGHPYEQYLLLALLFSANLDILFGVATPHGPGVMWSLAVEEHFYWVWPIVVRRASVRSLTAISAAIVILSPILRGLAMHFGTKWESVYQLSWFRFDGLAMGALLAIFVRTRYFTVRNTWTLVIGWLGLVAATTIVSLPFGVFQSHTPMAEALRYTQAQAIFTSAIAIAMAHQGSILCAFLRTGFARWTAQLSYCLYLIHLPLGDLYYWILHHFGVDDVALLGSAGALLARYIIILPTAYTLAALSQKILEGPFLRLRTTSHGLKRAAPLFERDSG